MRWEIFQFSETRKKKETKTTNCSCAAAWHTAHSIIEINKVSISSQHNLIFAGLISSELIFSSFNLFSISSAVSPWTNRLIKIPPWRVSQIFSLIGSISNFQPKANFSPSLLVANFSSPVDRAVGKLAKKRNWETFFPFVKAFISFAAKQKKPGGKSINIKGASISILVDLKDFPTLRLFLLLESTSIIAQCRETSVYVLPSKITLRRQWKLLNAWYKSSHFLFPHPTRLQWWGKFMQIFPSHSLTLSLSPNLIHLRWAESDFSPL